ncbi:TetR family transcriptional regulator [Pseudodesulfovibrio sp. F-1]|uniref:TetR family transcriptional regulator n=1 Tax=Pseudodesulfovibrio alkaliphilus TaxID=2661613 RepID=A0A7K1KJB6_9BACT|nr:TetR/AcrR family transcriptional regulator [Pseudodesulfovibrio alkaliphilus]MUM76154.1 TetR family transcriptional regulator [Pseudodesulfovibrio alkaliphilus]
MESRNRTFENLPGDKRERVLAEATREFAEHGYHQASVNRMVQRLGIAKGSLFKYFGSKQGIFEYLFSQTVAEFKKPLKAIRDDESGDLFERIERTLLAGAEFVTAHPLVYGIYLKMVYQQGFPMRDTFLGEIRTASDKYLRTLVANAAATGQLRPDIDQGMAALHLDAVMDRFLQSCAVPALNPGGGDIPDRETTRTRARAVADFLRRGLGAHSANSEEHRCR